MLLAIDSGNTNITLGVFDGDNIIRSGRLTSEITRTEDELGLLIKNLLQDAGVLEKINSAVIASVSSNLTYYAEKAVIKYLGVQPLMISHKIKMNIELKTDTPYQTGADRIANAAAAAALYPLPAVIVDFGTASSFDIINSKKEFTGGIIAAGIKIQAEALGSRTSKLPKLNIEAPNGVIGRNTEDAMLSGIVLGHAAMIDGLLDRIEKELNEKPFVIGTGGFSNFISRYMKYKFDCIEPDLTLKGLKILYEINNKQS